MPRIELFLMSHRLSSDCTIMISGASSQRSSPDEDARLTVDFDIEEDVEAELSEFARLSYTGHFVEAEGVFRECLSAHENLFPVAAEYGDFLLRQEKFRELSLFTLKKTQQSYGLAETKIFELMNLIAELHCSKDSAQLRRGLNKFKVDCAGRRLASFFKSLGDIEEHHLDLHLRVAAITYPKLITVISKLETHIESLFEGWNGFLDRYGILLRNGRFWEAQGVFAYLLSRSAWEGKELRLLEYCLAVESAEMDQNEIEMALTYLVQTMLQLGLVKRAQYKIELPGFHQEESAAGRFKSGFRQADSAKVFMSFRRRMQEEPTPTIHSAVKYGQLDDLLLLLDQGDDPSALDSNKQTPLHLAAIEGDVEMIQVLIANGASSNLEDSMGRLPLHLAARNGHIEAVIALIGQGIPIDPVYSDRKTPLSLAAQEGHWMIVEIFLEQDSASCVRDPRFEGILRAVAKQGNVELMQSLIVAIMKAHSEDHEFYTEHADGVPIFDEVVHTNIDNLEHHANVDSRYVDGEGTVPDEQELSIEARNVDDKYSRKRPLDDDDSSEYNSTKPAKTAPIPKRRTITDQGRLYTCVFARYGCTARFSSKNEWKRHVTSQHLRPGVWRCDLGACVRHPPSSTIPAGGDDCIPHWVEFNRKDLFAQHIRRMHGPSITAPKEEKRRFEDSLEATRVRCYISFHGPPPRSRCGFCRHEKGRETIFEGKSGWEERMEHVGRHLERGEKEEDEDIELKEWMINEGLMDWDEVKKKWEVKGAKKQQEAGYELC